LIHCTQTLTKKLLIKQIKINYEIRLNNFCSLLMVQNKCNHLDFCNQLTIKGRIVKTEMIPRHKKWDTYMNTLRVFYCCLILFLKNSFSSLPYLQPPSPSFVVQDPFFFCSCHSCSNCDNTTTTFTFLRKLGCDGGLIEMVRQRGSSLRS